MGNIIPTIIDTGTLYNENCYPMIGSLDCIRMEGYITDAVVEYKSTCMKGTIK